MISEILHNYLLILFIIYNLNILIKTFIYKCLLLKKIKFSNKFNAFKKQNDLISLPNEGAENQMC